MKSRPLSPDRLSMLPRDKILPAAGRALHAIQNEQPEEMVAAASMLFAMVCSRVGLDPQSEHHRAMRMLTASHPNHDKENKLLQSLRDFAGLRIAGQDVVAS